MAGNPSLQRQKGKRFVKKIVVGSTSYPVTDESESNSNSHVWTVYLKPYYDEDLSTLIQKVQFTLHESYAVTVREVVSPPYELTETGWGEFEITITLFFANNAEKPVHLYHVIRLFPVSQSEPSTKEKPLVSEHYEELVFIDPPDCLYASLLASDIENTSKKLSFQHFSNWELIIENTKKLIKNAQDRICDEISSTKQQLEDVRNDCIRLKEPTTLSELSQPKSLTESESLITSVSLDKNSCDKFESTSLHLSTHEDDKNNNTTISNASQSISTVDVAQPLVTPTFTALENFSTADNNKIVGITDNKCIVDTKEAESYKMEEEIDPKNSPNSFIETEHIADNNTINVGAKHSLL